MTLISVGSTGTPGSAKGARGAADNDEAAPTGFEALLADAGEQACDGPAHAEETEASDTSDATDTAGGAAPDDGTEEPVKPDAPVDPFGLVAALAAPIPTTPVTPVPVTDATATVTGEVPVTDVTTVVPDPTVLVDGAGNEAPPTPATVDLTEILATLTPDDAESAPDPAPLPLPDLPVTPTRTAPAETSALTRETFAPAAAAPERARPPVAIPAPSGAATFAPPAPPPFSAAMAVAAVEESAAAGRTAPPPPAEQLVSVLTPLRNTPNGTYTLRLELKPPELGRIEMRVEMRDGVLHASIQAEQHSSAQVLRDALADLRDRLGAGGVHTGDLTVSDGSVGSRQNASGRTPESRAAQLDGTAPDGSELTDTPVPLPTLDPEATSLLDVRV